MIKTGKLINAHICFQCIQSVAERNMKNMYVDESDFRESSHKDIMSIDSD